MSLHFYSYARKGYEFIEEVSTKINATDTDKTGRMIRCVLRAIRNRLTYEASFELLAQLPMALKAIYADGWKFHLKFQKINNLDDFIAEVIKEDKHSGWNDLLSEHEVRETIVAVFQTLLHQKSVTEADLIRNLLPSDLKSLLTHEHSD
ncbi:MAG: DUF2267 domain-containing protein [Bacteroidetes bacterium]|nr:DUF2267 domain-containing protein [Bacteroidota bacterium]